MTSLSFKRLKTLSGRVPNHEVNYECVQTHVLFQSRDFLFRFHQFELEITHLPVGVSWKQEIKLQSEEEEEEEQEEEEEEVFGWYLLWRSRRWESIPFSRLPPSGFWTPSVPFFGLWSSWDFNSLTCTQRKTWRRFILINNDFLNQQS